MPRAPKDRPPAAPPSSLLAVALRDVSEGILIAKRETHRNGFEIVFANQAFCRMTGHPPKGLLGKRHGFLHLAKSDLKTFNTWAAEPRLDKPLEGEGYLKSRDRASLYAAWTFSAMADETGEITHVVAAYRDLTEKRRLQEALLHSQRLDAVGRLAGGVAHDFNNLLSVINGYCEILADQVADQPKALHEVNEIHHAGKKAIGLVRQLLAFSRSQTLDPKVINLNSQLGDSADILVRLLKPHKRITFSLGEGLENVRADPHQLQQVVLNLVLNARDALEPGGLVNISTTNRTITPGLNRRLTDMPPGEYVLLTVSDNGCGMDAETQDHLFEPFYTTKDEGKGTGLGLAMVYGVVQQSGGFISVHSAVGLGSTFEIFLPAVQELAERAAQTLLPLPATRGAESVLLVEPDDLVRKMVEGILVADGYRVTATAGHAQALSAARRLSQPPLLLIQAETEVDGTKLAHALHQANPALRVLRTPGRATANLPWIRPEFQGEVIKPFALAGLVKAVRTLLDAEPN